MKIIEIRYPLLQYTSSIKQYKKYKTVILNEDSAKLYLDELAAEITSYVFDEMQDENSAAALVVEGIITIFVALI